jgi:hypothetical protein
MKALRNASIANAVIWAAVIIATAIILHGTPQAGMVVVILGGAAGGSIITLEDALRSVRKELTERQSGSEIHRAVEG